VPVTVVGVSCLRGTRGRQRLVERAVDHLQGVEHERLHHCREALAGHVREQLLHQRDAAAGVLEGLIRRAREQDGADVRRRLAVEDLDQRRPRRRWIVAREPEAIVGASGVAREAARRDGLIAGQLGCWHLPRLQERVDVRIQ
jgi:hypothetical protein